MSLSLDCSHPPSKHSHLHRLFLQYWLIEHWTPRHLCSQEEKAVPKITGLSSLRRGLH